MSNFLVTGGAGFIGSHIVERLVNAGIKPRVIDNMSTGSIENIRPFLPNIELIIDTITDISVMNSACEDIDYIIHQAAIPSVPRSLKDPFKTNLANVAGTLSVLWSAANCKCVKKVVYASSSSVYGNQANSYKHESMKLYPESPYAVSKLAGEEYAKMFWSVYGLNTIGLRYFNVFGPRQDPNSQYSAVIPKFIKAVLNNDSAVIYGNGEQTRDFTYVENVVNANLAVIESTSIYGGVFNVGCGKETSINTLLSKIKKIGNNKRRPKYLKSRKGDVINSLASIEKLRQYSSYSPLFDLDEGLKKTFEWYKNNRI